MAMTEPVEIRLLGPLEVLVGGRRVDVSGPKRQALVALLALRRGQVLPVEVAVDALWGPDLPAAPRNAVQHHVTRLRAALGPETITSAHDGYVLRDVAVDAATFEERLTAARGANRAADLQAAAAIAAGALSLWRGSALQGLLDAGWVVGEARRLAALRADALEEQFHAALGLGEHADIVGPLTATLQDHPYRERLWAQLMLALYRSGRQVDALAAYQQAREVLSERLGIEPGPELQRLQAAILAHDLALRPDRTAARRRRGTLPTPLDSFVGREEALGDVLRALRQHRLVTLTGPPGVGKSRLGLEAARAIEPELPDGAWLADLTAASGAADVAGVVAGAVGARVGAGDGDPLAHAVERLRDARALLVLDGCGPVVDEAARVAATLLAACPTLQVLATSREVLHLPGEVRIPVLPLALPAAVRLFADRARAARPSFAPTAETADLVAEICRRLDGLSLVIEVAAARVNVLGLREILAALEHRSVLLAEPHRLASGERHSLGSLVSWSYDLLLADERAVLHVLAGIRGGAGLTAVVAAAARHGMDRTTVARLLGALADKSVIIPSFAGQEPCYDLLETIRDYVLQRSPRQR